MVNLKEIVRKGLWDIKAYSTARNEFSGEAYYFMDANENPFNGEYSRYPDPYQKELRVEYANIKGVSNAQVFSCHGSDEAIDLLIRLFCEPRKDNIITIPPTYGMYDVSANINLVHIIQAPLKSDFSIDKEAILSKISNETKIIFLCSPNNPTGNCIPKKIVEELASQFRGIIVVDEAYIDFSGNKSCVELLKTYKNIIVLQTLSKAWGLAGIRIGFAIGHPKLIALLDKIKPPYNIGSADAKIALKALRNKSKYEHEVKSIIQERERLIQELATIDSVKEVFPSEANFILVRFKDASSTFELLKKNGIVVRDRSSVKGCDNCLRISIGQKEENNELLNVIRKL